MANRLRNAWDYYRGKKSSVISKGDYVRIMNKARLLFDKPRNSSYDPARTDRRYSSWPTSTQVPYYDTSTEIHKVVARSRDVYRDDPFYRRAIKALTDLVVGSGIQPKPKVYDKQGKLKTNINKELEDLWKQYNEPEGWDATGRSEFVGGGQRLLFQTELVSGNVFLNRVNSRNTDWKFAWQVFEFDRLDTSADIFKRTFHNSENVKQTAHGINLDEYGKPVSYWIKGLDKPVSSDNIIHSFHKERPESYVGMPWGVASLNTVWDKKEIMEDYIVKVHSIASLVAWLSDIVDLNEGDKDSDDNLVFKGGELLRTQNNIEPIRFPDNVNETLIPFKRSLEHEIAAGLGISYITVSFDLANANFASANMVNLKEWQTVMTLRNHFVGTVCKPMWKQFVTQAILSGKVKSISPSAFVKEPLRYLQSEWVGEPRMNVDPVKFTRAAIEDLKGGRKSLTEDLKSRGKNIEEFTEELALEKDLFESKGLAYPYDGEEDNSETEIGNGALEDEGQLYEDEDEEGDSSDA